VTLGPAWAFGLNAVSYFALVAALTMIRKPPFPRAADRPPGPIREGIAYAWRHLRTRWMLLSIVAIGIALDPITTLSPALAQDLGIGRDGAGWIVAAWGGGAVLMILVAGRLIRAISEHGLGWVGLVALAAGVAGLGVAPTVWLAIPAAVLAGVGYITATMAFTTTIQQDVPESLRGRVSALWTLAFLGPRAIAGVVDGALGDLVGVRSTTVMFATVALVAAVLLRRVIAPKGEPVPPPA
jgi:predicted MFS family arabinose efflux permease